MTTMINNSREKNSLAQVLSRPDLLGFLLWQARYLLLHLIFTFSDQIQKYFRSTHKIFKHQRDLQIFKKMIKFNKTKWFLGKMKKNNRVFLVYHLMKISCLWEIIKIIHLIKITEKIITNKWLKKLRQIY